MTIITPTQEQLAPQECGDLAALRIMGVKVTPLSSYEQALAHIGRCIEQGKKTFWAAINPQKMYRAWHEPELAAALEKADAGIIDGVGVSLAARILMGRRLSRVTGCDLFNRLIPLAAQRGWRVFLLGASGKSSELAAQNLQRQYPNLRIVGRQDGFFKDDADVVRQINQASPDVLLVAMGSPRQEIWITKNMPDINARFFMGIGGSLDVAAGLSSRARSWLRRLGLEFFYQLLTQPWRWRRQIVYVPFIMKVFRQKLTGRPVEEAP